MRSPLATLVHQGSDPTLPHQALGDPTERHAFLEGVKAPRGHQALFGPSAIAVRWGQSPLTHSILPSSPPVAAALRAGFQPADAARFDVRRRSGVARPGEVGPRPIGSRPGPRASSPGAV